ncbi:MAG: 3-hydroxyisobutyrate dehydrogenase [Solirubrobacteraceae bacterium]|nr:3-hydroxyisobutyrate dehydrogenase [Solirubrobacteraceae bacterium]
MKIAVLGTGIMGAPMARNLAAAGHEVTAWNRTPQKADGIEDVRAVRSPAEAVPGTDAVLTMLADGAAVEDVMGKALDAVPQDAVWWQCSTVGIEAGERLEALADRRGIAYVDAPVLGTRQPAEEGKLTVLASGPPAALDRLAPVFEAVGSKTVRLGEAGEGTRVKLVMNHWVLAVMTATAETIALAEALGVDPQVFLDTIAGGSLDCAYAQLKGKAILEDRVEEPSFELKLAHKDARLVLEAARRHEADLGLAPAIEERFALAEEAGLGNHDMAAVGRVSGARARRS